MSSVSEAVKYAPRTGRTPSAPSQKHAGKVF